MGQASSFSLIQFRNCFLGKSLDKIAELREKGYIKDPNKKKKQSIKKQIAAEVRAQNKKVY